MSMCVWLFFFWGGGGLRDVRIAEGAFSLPFDEQWIVLLVLCTCTSINKKERRKILILKTRDQLLAKPSSWPVTNLFSFYVWDTSDAWPSCSNISTKVNNTFISRYLLEAKWYRYTPKRDSTNLFSFEYISNHE